MSTALQTTFLSDQDVSQIRAILAAYGLSGFDASVRFWGRGKAIEVRGTLGRQELSCLLAIARYLGDCEQSPGTVERPDANPPLPCAPPPIDLPAAVPTI